MSKQAAGTPSRSRSALLMLRQVSHRVSNLAEGFRQLNAEPLKDVEKGEGRREGSPVGRPGAEGGRRRGDERSFTRTKHESSHTRSGKEHRTEAALEKIPLAPAAEQDEREQRGRVPGATLAEDNVERSTGSDSRRADAMETPKSVGKVVSREQLSGGRMAGGKSADGSRSAFGERDIATHGTELLSAAGARGDTGDLQSLHTSASARVKGSLLQRVRSWVSNHLTDLFGSEMDFDTAYARATHQYEGLELGAQMTTYSDTTRDTVHAAEHIQFFPLRFRDASLEREYGQVCGQLFVGRDFLVLALTIVMIIPVTWWLASVCFQSVDLDAHSHGAWVAFQSACAVDLGVAILALTWLTIPALSRRLHSHFETFSYFITLLWMSVLMVVLATFPRLVMAPEQMGVLFNFSSEQIVGEIKKLSPLCRLLKALPGLNVLLERLDSRPADIQGAKDACVADDNCRNAAIQVTIESAGICANELAAALGSLAATQTLSDVWMPFAYYVGFVKQTLQVFKMPLLAVAVIIIHFGTGMMFMDSLSPSRTRFTIFLHILVVPICSTPFVLLRITYPSIIPIEESALFVFSFFVVATAGYLGRYAQEFQHRLLFCSWRLTSKRLGEMHEKLKQQKKQKKSSTAIEDLIAQVKECQSLCMLASSRGRRADVSAELTQIGKILENVLEVLTNTENLYSVRFTDDATQNEVQRQFIELYNKPDKRLRKMVAPSSLRRSGFTHKHTTSTTKDGEGTMFAASSGKTFGTGACPLPTFDQTQRMRSGASPVLGFEFGSSFHQMTNLLDNTAVPFQALPMPEFTHMLLSTVGIDWDFDMLQLSQKTENILVEVGYALLCRLVTDWGCDENCLLRFLVAIQAQYLQNPYHNAIHGAEVAHLTECLTRMLNAQRGMNSIDKVTLTVAAVCHDVGHPGRNNQFFVNSYDPLAVIYNDVAVLENFHSCLTFRTLETRDCNVFSNLDDSEFRFVRQNLIECILATDMKQHFESISRFRIRRLSPEFNYMKNIEDRWLLARMCVKVADIGHSSVPWTQHFDWSCRVVEEFYLQGDEELARGLPLSPLCDREKHADMGKSQAGFLEFVVKPLLKEIEEVDPFNRIKTEVSANIESNRQKWLMLQEEGTEIRLPSHVPAGLPESTVTSYAVHRIAGLRSNRTVDAGRPQVAKAAATAAAEAAAGFASGEKLDEQILPHAAQVQDTRGATPGEPCGGTAEEEGTEGRQKEAARKASVAATTTEGTEDQRRSSDYSGTSERQEGQLTEQPQQQPAQRPSEAEPEPPAAPHARQGSPQTAAAGTTSQRKAEQQRRTATRDEDAARGLSLSWEGDSQYSGDSDVGPPPKPPDKLPPSREKDRNTLFFESSVH